MTPRVRRLTATMTALVATVTITQAARFDARYQIVGAGCDSGNATVTDGEWRRDLFLSPRVSLDEATFIIRALRRGQIENKLPWPADGPRAGIAPVMPFIDANQITSIRLESTDAGQRSFNVQTGCMSGNSYVIVILKRKLELREIRVWVA